MSYFAQTLFTEKPPPFSALVRAYYFTIDKGDIYKHSLENIGISSPNVANTSKLKALMSWSLGN